MKTILRSLFAITVIFMLAVSLASCTAKPEKVESKLKDKGYEVEMTDKSEDLEMVAESLNLEGEIKAMVAAISEDGSSEVTVIWFEKKEDASDAKVILELAAKYMDYEVVQSGKIIVFGNGEAFEDACDVAKAK